MRTCGVRCSLAQRHSVSSITTQVISTESFLLLPVTTHTSELFHLILVVLMEKRSESVAIRYRRYISIRKSTPFRKNSPRHRQSNTICRQRSDRRALNFRSDNGWSGTGSSTMAETIITLTCRKSCPDRATTTCRRPSVSPSSARHSKLHKKTHFPKPMTDSKLQLNTRCTLLPAHTALSQL